LSNWRAIQPSGSRHLLINGSLPTKAQLDAFRDSITRHTMVNEQLLRFFQGSITTRIPWRWSLRWSASMAAFITTLPTLPTRVMGDLRASHHRQTADDRRCGL